MTVHTADAATLFEVEKQIRDLTGERFHLFSSTRGGGEVRVVFKDGAQVGYPAALAHASRFLELMQDPVPCGNTGPHSIHAWTRDETLVGCRGADRDLTEAGTP